MAQRQLTPKETDSLHRLIDAGITKMDKTTLIMAEKLSGGAFEAIKAAAAYVGSGLSIVQPWGGRAIRITELRVLRELAYFAIEDAKNNERVDWLEVAYSCYQGAGMQASEDGLRLRYLICFYYVVVTNGADRYAHLDEALAIDMQLSRIAGRKTDSLRECIAGHNQLEAMRSLGLLPTGLQGHNAMTADEFISKFKKGWDE